MVGETSVIRSIVEEHHSSDMYLGQMEDPSGVT